jgi:xyloglucan:xyloglucosyl transferase
MAAAATPPGRPSSGSCISRRAAVVPALLLLAAMVAASVDAQPSPGYYPSSRYRPVPFNRAYTNKWGPQHQTLSGDHSALTIWLDRTCGMLYYQILYRINY